MAVARGVIVQLSGDSATLSTDKPLPAAFAAHLRRDAGADGALEQNRQWDGLEGTPAQPSWRLDKDEVASVFVRLRRNLMGAGIAVILAGNGMPFKAKTWACLTSDYSS